MLNVSSSLKSIIKKKKLKGRVRDIRTDYPSHEDRFTRIVFKDI